MNSTKNRSLPSVENGEPPDQDDSFMEGSPDRPRWWNVPKRYELALMSFVGFFISSMMHDSFLNVLNQIFTYSEEERAGYYPKTMEWTMTDLRLMTNSYYLGVTLSHIPGALLVIRFSPHKLIPISVALSSILHVGLPFTIHHNVIAVIAVNFLGGFVSGPLMSASIGLYRSWAPPKERTMLVAIAYSGAALETFLGGTLIKYMALYLGNFTWFFAAGVLGVIWSLVWFVVTYESPSSHPRILQSELAYLERSIPVASKADVTVKSIPVKAILTSPSVLSLCVIALSSSSLSLTLTLATALHYHTGLEYSQFSYWIWDIHNFTYWISIIIGGFLSDFLTNRFNGKRTRARKMSIAGSLVFAALFFATSAAGGEWTNIVCFIFAAAFLGFSTSGFLANPLDLSPRYASFIVGLAGTFESLGGIACVIAVEETFQADDHWLYWRIMTLVVSALSALAAVAFAFFGSGEEQAWSATSSDPLPALGSRYYPTNDHADDNDLVTDTL